MKDRYYLLSPGQLTRKDNTLYFEVDENKKPIPVNKVYDLYATENVSISSGVFNLLSEKKTPLHIFSYGGKYLGTFLPPERIRSGVVTVNQAQLYNSKDRIRVARKFVEGAAGNMKWVLKNHEVLPPTIEDTIEKLAKKTKNLSTIPRLMEIEGKIQKQYYAGIDEALETTPFKLKHRTREPPENEVNAVISYINTLIYSRVVTEIYYTRLNQSISFLHEPQERRFSLSLDIAEIYKPLIGHSLMLRLFKQQLLKNSDFKEKGRAVLLSESGRNTVLQELDEKMNTTRIHPELEEPARWRRWPRIEAHKLTKDILEIQKYNPTTL